MNLPFWDTLRKKLPPESGSHSLFKINTKEKSEILRQGESILIVCELGLGFSALQRLKNNLLAKPKLLFSSNC